MATGFGNRLGEPVYSKIMTVGTGPGRPRKPSVARRIPWSVPLRLDERERVKAAASLAGMKPATWAREALNEAALRTLESG